MKTLYSELARFLHNKELASRVNYWRGFALWRRALNGFNDSADPVELRGDLEQAVKEFDEAVVQDPKFVDAKIGAASCLSNLMYLSQNDAARLRELIPKARQALKEAEAQAPDNPRLSWVLGPNAWYAPNEGERGQQKAMEMYEKGLAAIRANKSDSSDPLTPSWGEPELLMNLAWSNLHRTTPDLKAAKTYAESALKSIPYWHYVRDILLPQIEGAIRAQEGKSQS